jgi:hypothetical protein
MKKWIATTTVAVLTMSSSAFAVATLAAVYGAGTTANISLTTMLCDQGGCKREVAQIAKNDALAYLNGDGKSAIVKGLMDTFRQNNPELQVSDEALALQIIAESNNLLN